jgi:hypothetical protein
MKTIIANGVVVACGVFIGVLALVNQISPRYKYLYFGAGVYLVALGLYRIVKHSKKKNTPKKEAFGSVILMVDLTNVKVENISFAREKPAEIWETAESRMLDNIVGHNMVPKTEVVNQCTFEYTVVFNGETLTFVSSIIYKDRETLLFKLLMQKETKLYLDKDNPNNHHLDLDFLNN